MKSIKKKIVIGHTNGIHFRVASEIVKASQRFACESFLHKKNALEEEKISTKAILDLITAGMESGQEVEIECLGEDAEKAIEVLEYILVSDFDKPFSKKA